MARLINSTIKNKKPFLFDVAQGNVPGWSFVEKFGENPDIDTGTYPETMWSFGGQYVWPTGATIDRLVSSDVSDTQPIAVIGLDANMEEVTQVITLNGQTPVALTTPLWRCYRMANISGTGTGTPAEDNAGVIYCFENSAVTGGVPDEPDTVKAVISSGENQTEMCVYTIPAGKTGYFYEGYITNSREGNNAAIVTSRVRSPGSVFRVAARVALIGTGASIYDKRYEVPLEMPAGTDFMYQIDSVDANNTGVSGGFTILLVDDGY